jgi:hypothetical protein
MLDRVKQTISRSAYRPCAHHKNSEKQIKFLCGIKSISDRSVDVMRPFVVVGSGGCNE